MQQLSILTRVCISMRYIRVVSPLFLIIRPSYPFLPRPLFLFFARATWNDDGKNVKVIRLFFFTTCLFTVFGIITVHLYCYGIYIYLVCRCWLSRSILYYIQSVSSYSSIYSEWCLRCYVFSYDNDHLCIFA